jgi:L-fuculose-phosphate aldolase
MKNKAIRAAIVAQWRAMGGLGLETGASASLSARVGGAMLITPRASGRDMLRPDMLALMPIAGEYGAWRGPLAPSIVWRLHLDIMRARPEANAIIHCQPTYATVLSILKRPIPAAHEMIAAFGGPTIRCADYAPYGTREFAELAVAALAERGGALVGNHGLVAIGADLFEAMRRAAALETLARLYYLALAGRPNILPDDEVMQIVEGMRSGEVPNAPSPLKGAEKAARKPTMKRKSAKGRVEKARKAKRSGSGR